MTARDHQVNVNKVEVDHFSPAGDSSQPYPRSFGKAIHFVGKHYYLLLVVLAAVVMLFPIFITVSASFREPIHLFDTDQWIPRPFTLKNYDDVLHILKIPFTQVIFNTVKIALLTTIGQLFSCSLAAYALARLEFPGRNLIFIILLGTMMIPVAVLIVPQMWIWRSITGLTGGAIGFNTPWPLILPAFLGGALYTFFLRQFFLGIPKELEEAAIIDGAGRWLIFINVIIPLSKPALATVAVMTFLGAWNDFYMPSIFLRTPEEFTLTVALSFLQSSYFNQPGPIMASGVLSMLPILAIYLFAQRYFIEGITMTGLKA